MPYSADLQRRVLDLYDEGLKTKQGLLREVFKRVHRRSGGEQYLRRALGEMKKS